MGQVNLLEIVNVIVSAFVHFAIPVFVFISGFVLNEKYEDTFSTAGFYKRRFVSIVLPYLIFSAFCILVDYWFS